MIVDYLDEDFGVRHSGLMRKYFEENLRHVEGQLLEVYEGWSNKGWVRTVNLKVSCLLGEKKIYLPKDTCLKQGVVPKTWIVLSVVRVGDPRKEVYYPIYPRRVAVHVPKEAAILARLDELFYTSGGLTSTTVGLINKFIELRGRRRVKK